MPYYSPKFDVDPNMAGSGFQVRDVVRFFVVDLIVVAALTLMRGVGFFTTPDAHVLAILGSKLIIFCYVLWLVGDRRESWPDTGGATAGRWWGWPLSVAIYAACYVPLLWFDALNRRLMQVLYALLGAVYHYEPQTVLILTFEDILSTPVRVALVAFIVIIGPILEELAFRGMALDAFRRSGGMVWAMLATSLLFGLYHFSIPFLLPLSAMGLIFAFARVISGSLWCAVLVHCLHNGLTVALMAHKLGMLEGIPKEITALFS